ncbi:MAG: DNA-processing protein DprA [Coriobacteriales bacterium]|nr:DNA-processing protein DprA [Coriobacteriales bacterium]
MSGKSNLFWEGFPKHELCLGSRAYPEGLNDLSDPPKRLYVIGSIESLEAGIAIIGARKATPYGIGCAERFASLAAEEGVAVISGGAIGCDQAAHRGALDAHGKTVAVLGSGADVAYPVRGTATFRRILEGGGAIVSEEPWGTPPQRWAFRKRNRIIAALAKAVLIVEAGFPSGTLSTVDHSLEMNRDVMVIPGSIFSKESMGANRLLSEGAIPIADDESFRFALRRLFPLREQAKGEEADAQAGIVFQRRANATQLKIIDAISASPLAPDALIGIGGASLIEVLRNLSALETHGMVARYPDGRFGVSAAYVKLKG